MSTRRPGLGRLARWAVLATTLAMVAALVASSWANLRAVDDASETLYRGQGESLLLAARQMMRRFSGPPPAGALEMWLQIQEPAGLRYVGLFRRDGDLLVEAGEPTGEVSVDRWEMDRPLRVLSSGSRVLMRSDPEKGPLRDGPGRRPPREDRGGRPRFDDGPRFDDQPRPLGPRDRRPPGRPGPTVVIEFEPLAVEQLTERATRSLVASAFAGLLLLATAGVFWRFLQKREKAERRFEHQRRLQALGEMSAVMAHEIRNPLASLKGNAQILAERLSGEGRDRRKAERIVREATRLENLSQALLDFCRTRPIGRQGVDPAALVREAVASLEKGRVEIDDDDAPETWSLDPLRMRQVLLNLLGNARQASPEGRSVRVRVAQRNGCLEIAVRDHGDGIPPGDEEKIFEPFFTKRTRGTGLGLAVARRVVELHGGTLTASNVAEGGAELRVSIPGGDGWPESS